MLAAKTFAKWFSGSKKARQRVSAAHRRLRQAEQLEARALLAAEIFVAPSGDDWASGQADAPFQTIRRALDAAQPGDTITLRGGVYQGGINIDIDNLTLRSAPGEWAVIESPLTQLTDGRANSVIRYNYDVQGGKLENLELAGGYYYGVMFWDWWDPTWGPGTTHIGASGITLDGVKVHDTGVDAIKLTPGANDITIINSEIYNTGRRTPQSADGIDNNNGDRMVVRGNHIHNVAGIGVVISGGAEDALVEQNFIQHTGGAGVVAGFYSEAEWMEPATNPDYFTSLDAIVRNNLIVSAGHAGVGVYAAHNPQVYHNTLVNAAAEAQAPIQLGGIELWLSDADPFHHVASDEVTIVNNLIVTAPGNDTRMVDIRAGSFTGQLTLDHNLYHGTHERGVLFIDRNLTGDGTPEQTFSQWRANYGYDQHSQVADPQLGADWRLLAGSPAIGQALALAGVTTDFDGELRSGPTFDVGADEFSTAENPSLPPAAFGAPTVEIAARGYHDAEGQTVLVRVVRTGSTADNVRVQYRTLAGSARAGDDFIPVSGELNFAAGQTELFVPVSFITDGSAEGDEHLLFVLENAITDGSLPVRLGHQAAASLTIDDAETPLVVHYATKWVAPGGSDVTGDGSQANPWKSLQHAADQVGPGDFVVVQPGRYWGMNVTTDGKPDARITFHALPGVLIDEPSPENQLDGINLEGADFVTIEGFEVQGMPRAGLRSVNNDGAIFRNNRTLDNTMWGLLSGWSENILVENNVAAGSQVEHGIYISNSADGAVIRNNVVYGNNDSGIQFNADGGLAGDGVHSRNLIEGNVIFDNGRGGGAALNFDGVQESLIRNNLLYDNHATGIVLYVGFAADSSKNNVVVNNTVVMAADARWALLMTDGSSGNTLVNNILLNKNPNRGSMTVESNSLPAVSNFNIVQDLFQLDGYNSNAEGWLNFAAGADTHSLVIPQGQVLAALDSLFVNPSGGDFHLREGSAAIDRGSALYAPAVDLYQHPRPAGEAPDIGAFEFGAFLPAVQFEWKNIIGYEATGMAEAVVTRSGDTEAPLAVAIWSTTDSASPDAASASDYQAVRGYLVFQPGEVQKSFRVFVNDDAQIEALERVQLNLKLVGDPTGLFPTDQVGDPTGLIPMDQVGDPTGLAPDDQALLHLVSDDAWRPGSLGFAQASVTVNEADGVALVTVVRTGGADGEAAVRYAAELFAPPRQATWIKRHTELLYPTDRDQPATPGDDFTLMEGWLHFTHGETTKTIAVPLTDDAWYEEGEAFVLRLSEPTGGAALGEQAQLKVRIQSDDLKQPGRFVFSAGAYGVTEGQPVVNVTVQRVGGANVAAAVRLYHTGAGNGATTASAWAPSDYHSVPEELHFAAGETAKTLSIPIVDDSSSETDEVFSLQLHSPTNDALIGELAQALVTIADNESTFYFRGATPSAWSFEAVEGSGKLPVTVVRQGALSTPAQVTVSTSGGSAISGVDFTPTTETLNFAAGEASKTFDVPLVNDAQMESRESFQVTLSNPVGAQQGSWNWSAYIVDDDAVAAPGVLGFASALASVSEAGGAVTLTVTRTGGADGAVSVQYRTLDGASGKPTAWAGADYTSKSGVISFAPGETSKTISIPITNDTSVEANEAFTVELRSPACGATLGAVTRTVVTIVEDDSAIEFGGSSYTVSEGAGAVLIKLVRKGATESAAAVDLLIGGATAGADYVKPLTPTVTFAAGESEKWVAVEIIDDLFKEGDEWLYLSLANAQNSKLGGSLWGNVKITDND